MFAGRQRRETLLLLKALMARSRSNDDEGIISPTTQSEEVCCEGVSQLVNLGEEKLAAIEAAVGKAKGWNQAVRELEAEMRDAFKDEPESQPESVWKWGQSMDHDSRERYSGRKLAILHGIRVVAESYRSCKVGEMRFRKASVERATRYADSGVAVGPTGEACSWEKIGKVQEILRVGVSWITYLITSNI